MTPDVATPRVLRRSLLALSLNVRIVSFSELPAHGDVSDWIDQGGSKAQLLERAKTARVPPPPGGSYTLVRATDVVTRAMNWLLGWPPPRWPLELMAGPPGRASRRFIVALSPPSPPAALGLTAAKASPRAT